MKIKEFFNSSYVNFGSYDNIRKISNFCDGLKNASRKVIYTFLQKDIKKATRVDIASNLVTAYSLYIHGNISGSIINLAQNFVGSNNLNLLAPRGKFGKRLNPSAAAVRYISTNLSFITKKIFRDEDFPILEQQEFEGQKIEPRFFVPIIPMLLVNGSQAPSVGFAQKIFPRNPKEIIQFLKEKLKDKNKKFESKPYFKGFTGKIEYGKNENKNEDKRKIIFKGNFERKNNTIIITELPLGYNLTSYIKILQKLKENKKIKGWKDKSDTKKDIFRFEVQVKKEILDLSDEEILEFFKLIKRETENFTCIDENNKIKQFQNENEVFENYFKIRLLYYKKRKEFELKRKREELIILVNKYKFVEAIINKKIIVFKKSKQEIIDQIKNILKIKENNFDYLLNMSIYSLTDEKMKELKNKILKLKKEYQIYKNTSIEQIWLNELNELDKLIN